MFLCLLASIFPFSVYLSCSCHPRGSCAWLEEGSEGRENPSSNTAKVDASGCLLLWLKMPSSKHILTLQRKTSHCGISEISSQAGYKRTKHLFDAVKAFCPNDSQKVCVCVYGSVMADLMTLTLFNTRYMGRSLSCPCPHSFKTEDRSSKLSPHLEKEKSHACEGILQGVECKGLL